MAEQKSDSDVPDKLPENASEFWVRKMRSFFIIFDLDRDCFVSRADYVDNVVERGRKVFKDEKKDKFVHLVKIAWDIFWAPKGKEIDGVFKTDIDGMVLCHSRALLGNKEFHEHIVDWFTTMFDGVDANSDGFISFLEYQSFLSAYGVHPLSVEPSFKALDTNHDGLISREEFVGAGLDYFYLPNDTVAKLFWGPFKA